MVSLFFFFAPLYSQSNYWMPVSNPNVGTISSFAFDANHTMLIGTDSSGPYRSSDNGITWHSILNGLNDTRINAIYSTPQNTYMVATKQPRMYRSTDFGANWAVVSPYVFEIDAFVKWGSTLFAGGLYGGLWKSTNDGIIWNQIDQPYLNYFEVYDMLVSPDSVLYFCGRDGGCWTNDQFFWHFDYQGGHSLAWSPFTGIMSVEPSRKIQRLSPLSVAIDASDHRFISTVDSGVFHSLDHGLSWLPINTGLEGETVSLLEVDNNNYLYAVTTSGKIFKSTRQTIELLLPVLVSPRNDTVDIRFSTTLKWRRAPLATSYHVQVSKDSTFTSSFIVDDALMTDTTLSLNNLDSLTRYYWRVASQNNTTISEYSPSRKFLVGPPPGIAMLVTPDDLTIDIPNPVTIRWRSVPHAKSYILCLSTSYYYLHQSGQTVTDTSITLDLERELTYYWDVQAVNDAGVGEYSLVRQFKTLRNAPTSAPVLQSPADNSKYNSLDPTLRWATSTDVNGYDVQVAFDQYFTNIIYNETTLVAGSIQLHNTPQNTSFFWRVRSRNVGGVGPYSTARKFTTLPLRPEYPSIVFPSNNATDISREHVLLTWNTGIHASGYKIQLTWDSTFNTIWFEKTTAETSAMVNYFYFSGKYYWRIQPRNDTFNVAWSSYNTFTTKHWVPEVRDGFPYEFVVEQNNPNPFREVTAIRYFLPRDCNVYCDIFDMLGKKVTTLVSAFQPQGWYEVFWRPDVETGIYFFRFEAFEVPELIFPYTSIKKMVYIR